MLPDPLKNSVDYLVIGHLTRDIDEQGEQLGGSAAYAALTAAAFGLKVGIVTNSGTDINLKMLENVPIANNQTSETTTFESWLENGKRKLKVHQLAAPIQIHNIPVAWMDSQIVHLAPVLGEVSPNMARQFEASSLGLTPQGWLRELDEHGNVQFCEWPEADFVLQQSMAAVISEEDLLGHTSLLNSLATSVPILANTQGKSGAEIFQYGEKLELAGISSNEIDSTGAGDIFASAFFIRLHFGDSIEEAGRVANLVASKSVERRGLLGVPTADEIYDLIPKAA